MPTGNRQDIVLFPVIVWNFESFDRRELAIRVERRGVTVDAAFTLKHSLPSLSKGVKSIRIQGWLKRMQEKGKRVELFIAIAGPVRGIRQFLEASRVCRDKTVVIGKGVAAIADSPIHRGVRRSAEVIDGMPKPHMGSLLATGVDRRRVPGAAFAVMIARGPAECGEHCPSRPNLLLVACCSQDGRLRMKPRGGRAGFDIIH